MAHGARQHAALDVAALAREIFRRVAMADALDVLVDDRAFVEVARNIMRGGADQLDAALMGLVIGPRALEARQERVVDVDAAPFPVSCASFQTASSCSRLVSFVTGR
jgi:hypothetical protein